MKIRWTHEALLRLFEIEDFISQDSPDRARKFVDQIVEHTKSLSDNPLSGRTVPEISSPDLKELIFRKYRIVYRMNKNNLDILTVFDGHRLLCMDEIDS
ncbi:MAG: plasmid stabilization protein [Desulfobacterales bacterium CG07_land_8_20_14_0_80_52_14]|nr:MAG: plasmid stabilization protein [Desulfobacterales bacterium CG23_combo_of_CG06-09_8_20_14_all_52_9]PIU48936.1 MAG: plasmid stabilization protein [Desulfobacterales bacterium CG07_land_8_20_14_0_80_52_14]